MSEEMERYESAAPPAMMPMMSLHDAIARRDTLVEFVKKIMVGDHDFGVIPGARKPSLLKPGAEKLNTFFGLSPDFILTGSIEDWDGADHNGEPFFYYRYSCALSRDGRVWGQCEGSCNSREVKYRYREGQRSCPECGARAIIKGREEYGGGWLCFAKKGGCGAKFGEGDQSIISQQIGRVLNPDIADLVNTMQKIAQKRALVGASLLATNASEFFTQDIEDMPEFINQSSAQRKEPPVQPQSKKANGDEAPQCPKCGGEMKLVPAGRKKDGKAYSAFWGCKQGKEKCGATIRITKAEPVQETLDFKSKLNELAMDAGVTPIELDEWVSKRSINGVLTRDEFELIKAGLENLIAERQAMEER